MDIFNKNLEALQKIDPTLANKLKHTNYSHYEIYQGNDPANINYINTEIFKPVYEHPIKETLQKIEEFKKYKNYPILYFFGLGNGIFYKMLLANPKHEKIVIYEPDIEIIYMTLNLIDFSEEFKQNKIQIIPTKNYSIPQAYQLLSDWQFKFFLKTYDLHILTPFYAAHFQDEILKINEINIEVIKQIVISHGNDATDSIIGVKHGIHNIKEMVTNYKFADLIKQKNSDVAIIVSTGPSLNKQLPLLKKAAPYATIISVDASLPILEKEGIKPDIVCVLERVELTSQFFINTSDEFMKDIHFVIASLAHEKTLNAIKGHKVITMRPFLYNKYLELDEFGYVGIGMSAANMAYELAHIMGYKTVVLIGQDLAYGDNVSHAKGHVLGEDEVKYKPDDIYVEAYGGKGKVRSYKFWNIFRLTFEKDIHEISHKMTTINATEGGARIHGALEIPFKEVIKNLNIPKKNIHINKIKKEDSIKYLKKAIDKLENGIKYGYEKKAEFENVFLKVAKTWDDLVFLNKTNQLDKIDFEHLLTLSDEIDEIKEILNDEKFKYLFFDILQPFLINEELELATVTVRPTNTEIEKQAKIIDWVMKHKEWLFTVAGSIDTQLHVMKEELDYLKEEYKKLS